MAYGKQKGIRQEGATFGYEGEFLTVKEWASKLGCTCACIYMSMYRYGSVNGIKRLVLKGPPGKGRQKKTIEYKGETLPVTEWAIRAGVTPQTLNSRLRKYSSDVVLKQLLEGEDSGVDKSALILSPYRELLTIVKVDFSVERTKKPMPCCNCTKEICSVYIVHKKKHNYHLRCFADYLSILKDLHIPNKAHGPNGEY